MTDICFIQVIEHIVCVGFLIVCLAVNNFIDICTLMRKLIICFVCVHCVVIKNVQIKIGKFYNICFSFNLTTRSNINIFVVNICLFAFQDDFSSSDEMEQKDPLIDGEEKPERHITKVSSRVLSLLVVCCSFRNFV